MVGILLTGCQKLGVKNQSEKVDRNGKTGHGSTIFSSIFGAYGIPLMAETTKKMAETTAVVSASTFLKGEVPSSDVHLIY